MRKNQRRAFLLAAGALLVAPRGAVAQADGRKYRIGIVIGGSESASISLVDAFKRGLLDLEYVEGKNLTIETRHGNGILERVPGLVAEVLDKKVDVIFTLSTVVARAAMQLTRNTPIVIGTASDPVGDGLIASLSRPGGNVTGLSVDSEDLVAKRFEILNEVVPRSSRIALMISGTGGGTSIHVAEARRAARQFKKNLVVVELADSEHVVHAFQNLLKQKVEALVVAEHSQMFAARGRIAELAQQSRMPSFFGAKEYVESGGLLSYGADYSDLCRRAAKLVAKIFKGEKPANLPVELPSKFQMAVNLKTAKALGIKIPQSLLFRTDEVIQ